jgi:hypothetical protein
MVERSDPGRAGVRAGRIVGVLTAALVVVTLTRRQESFYQFGTAAIEALGVEFVPVAAVFWLNAGLAAVSRYGFTYVVGSLVGVLYDALGRPHVAVLVPIVLVVGLVDGAFGALDARSLAVGGAYVLAWLCYVPAFAWLFDDDGTDFELTPTRLG